MTIAGYQVVVLCLGSLAILGGFMFAMHCRHSAPKERD
jgi:hypothetical protein